jgi:uncharacterized protein
MSALVHVVKGEGPREEAPIAADRLVEGSPRTVTRLDYQRGDKLFVGEWSASVGAWRVKYEEWEFCHVLDGACELVGDDGVKHAYRAGDSFIIEPGFNGVWRVLEPMRKRFVVRID